MSNLQSFLSSLGSVFGINIVWKDYDAVSNFLQNRFLVLRGFNGVAYFGKTFYVSRRSFLRNYKQSANFKESISGIIDATGNNLLPIAVLEALLVEDGTFEIRRRLILFSTTRTHLIGSTGQKVLLPNGYSHFGHFVPQLLPFLIRESTYRMAINLPIPDDINRNVEILNHFQITPQKEITQFRRLSIQKVVTQVGLYPSKAEVRLLQSLHDRKHLNANGTIRLYLTRENASLGRKIVNEGAVLDHLSRLGFLVIDPSTLDFNEAAILFANSEIVVGACGSALAHIVAMKRPATVIELAGNKLVRWHFRKIALDLGIKHYLILNESTADHDITVHLPTLLQILNQVITRSND